MKINEVSKLFDITADTLRYYERIGLIHPVPRNHSGIREYGEEECKSIEFVKCMRAAGISIDSLIEYMALFRQGDATKKARKAILVNEKKKLLARMKQMEETLARLDYKINLYNDDIKNEKNNKKLKVH